MHCSFIPLAMPLIPPSIPTANSQIVPDIKEAQKRFYQSLMMVISYTLFQFFIALSIHPLLAYVVGGVCLFAAILVVLKKILPFLVSKICFIVGILAGIFLLSLLQGPASMVYLYLFPLVVVVPLWLEKKDYAWIEMASYYSAALVLVVIICFFNIDYSNRLNLSAAQQVLIRQVNIVSALLYTVVFVIAYVYIEHRYHSALLLQIQKAEESIVVRNGFLSNMGHEIRTPLNGIVGAANYLEKNISSITQLEYIGIIKFCSQHILGLSNDLLDHKKIEAGEFTLSENQFNLKQLLQQNCSTFVNEFHDKGLEFKVNIDEALDVIVASDELRLIQVINNIIGNALKFTEHGFVKFEARSLTKKESKIQLYCSVEDSGIGISKENKDKIFDSFSKVGTTPTTAKAGAGLGLSIAQSLLKLMGGNLMVDSEEYKGSTFFFTITLPIVKTKFAENFPQQKSQAPINLQGLKILVAEDNKLTMLLTTRVLQEAQADVVATLNGATTLQRLKEESDFNLILLDLNMPEIDGYDVMKEIKAHYAHIPTLAFTANLLNNDTYQSLLRQGFADCVLKPFEPEELLTTVKRFASKQIKPRV